jgi:DNA-binding LytR/AlgR family response regulator
MKLVLNEQRDISETEVEIRYAAMNITIQNLINHIEQGERYIYGEENGREYRILTNDIYYAESIDRKTFIYTKSNVFRSELKLYKLLDRLKNHNFVQVSKFCILNINVLENIQTLFNSRMEGTLENGEKVMISRTYIPGIRAAFTRGNDVL